MKDLSDVIAVVSEGDAGLSGASPLPLPSSYSPIKRGRGRPRTEFVLSGLLPEGLSEVLGGLSRSQWTDVVGLAPEGALRYDKRVESWVATHKVWAERQAFRSVVGPDILGQADIYGVVFHPAVFEFLAASRASSLYGMTFNTFKVLILCYIVTAREGGDKYLSVVDISKSGLIATQTCRDQFHTLENMGMVSKVRYLDVHACRGNLAKRRINYYMLTMEGKEIIREFYKAYVKKLGQFQDMFGKLETSFKFK